MILNKEGQLFGKHIAELARSAYHKDLRIYTDFLNLNEISIFHAMITELPDIGYSLWGGIASAERKRVCFHGDLTPGKNEILNETLIQTSLYPIICIKIQPANRKFAEDLSHRDYLGAILNLGINRSKIGDIFIKDSDAFVFCDSIMSRYLMDTLEKIRHTNVVLEKVDPSLLVATREYQVITGTVSSIRLDSIISIAFHSSRSSMLSYITSGKVFVNGREVLYNSYQLKDGDIISVRGLGKVKYEGQSGITKKGRISITLLKYI